MTERTPIEVLSKALRSEEDSRGRAVVEWMRHPVPAKPVADDLCAVLSIDWQRAEVLAREVVRELRECGHPGGDVRVVWRVVALEPCGEHDLISPTLRALDRAEAWSGYVERARWRVLWHLWGDGACGTGRADDCSERLPPARELVAMGLRIGRITDDAVTLVCPRG